jgi:hypothetical protein
MNSLERNASSSRIASTQSPTLLRKERRRPSAPTGWRPDTALEAIAVLAVSSLPEAIALRGRALALDLESLPAEGINLKKLRDPFLDASSPEAAALLVLLGRLHSIRTIVGLPSSLLLFAFLG